MRSVLLIIFLFVAQISLAAQIVEQSQESEHLKAAVQSLAGSSKERVKVTLRNLSEVEGNILLSSDPLYFLVRETAKKARKGIISVAYADVLELEGEDVFISFFPDPRAQGFGNWEEVRKLQVGDSIEIEFEEGKTSKGVFYGATDSKLSILNGNKTIDFNREKTIRVFRLRAHSGTKTEKVLKSAGKGVGVVNDVAKNIPSIHGPISGQTAKSTGASSTGKAIGAGVGAGIAAVKRERQKRLLIFAK